MSPALFVAINEFPDAELGAELMGWLGEAGCSNHQAALALLGGDLPTLEALAACSHASWAQFHTLVANDAHLSPFAPLIARFLAPARGGEGAGAEGGKSGGDSAD